MLKMMKWSGGVLLMGFLMLVVAACHKPTDAEVAAQTAKVYYDHLLQGRYDDYVAGLHQPDSIPASYKAQLSDNAKMFIAQQKKEHRGIREIRVANAATGSSGATADVFLVFVYGDGATEQVLVPMIKANGVWYLR